MIRPAFDDEKDKPLDPAVEKVRKKLVRFVAINLGLLFLALMAVVGAIVYKSRNAGHATAGSAGKRHPGSRRQRAGSAISRFPPAQESSRSRFPATGSSLDIELPGGAHASIVYDHRRAPHRRPLRGHREMSGPAHSAPARKIATVALVVADYDEAIAWYTQKARLHPVRQTSILAVASAG